jgi:hypothetical protein
MKKMGFFGVAEATTLMGEVMLDAAVGFETVNGKSFDPAPQAEFAGSCAIGAGSVLVLGDHVMGAGGVEGKEGCDGVGVGAGVVGVGVLGVPQPDTTELKTIKSNVPRIDSTLRRANPARILQPPGSEKGWPTQEVQDRERRTTGQHTCRPSNYDGRRIVPAIRASP